jgi:hypothetical protein
MWETTAAKAGIGNAVRYISTDVLSHACQDDLALSDQQDVHVEHPLIFVFNCLGIPSRLPKDFILSVDSVPWGAHLISV